MSLWRIAWIYLWDRWLTTSLTILSVALAVGLISAILTVRDETRRRFAEEQQAYDLVVGQGSPLQLVLNAVYFLDNPTGSMSYADYERLKAEDSVEYAFPVLLGDSYSGFRIVGTTAEMFKFPWKSAVTGESRYPFQIEGEGRFFERPMEAVVGYLAARTTGLRVGDTFVSTHGTSQFAAEISGVDHGAHPYTVVAVLKPSGTSNDRAIFVDMQSVWDIHAEHEENSNGDHAEDEGDRPRSVTAVLIDLDSPASRYSVMGHVMADYKLTAAVPIDQIQRLYDQILAPAVVIMVAIGYVVVVISALAILIGLYLAIIQRRRDLAIMRALGAAATEIFGAVLIEAFLVSVMGVAAGWVLGKAVAIAISQYMVREYGFALAGYGTSREEFGFFAVVSLVGLLAGILPAWQAYRTDVARDLQAN
jgi:putative ABC transport system permease protein